MAAEPTLVFGLDKSPSDNPVAPVTSVVTVVIDPALLRNCFDFTK